MTKMPFEHGRFSLCGVVSTIRTRNILLRTGLILLLCGVVCCGAAGAEDTSGLPTDGGDLSSQTYTLTDNLQITGTLNVPNGVTCTINLNGYMLQMIGSGSVISVQSDGNLTLEDSGSSGKITGGNAVYGGGVYVKGGTFTMNGGTIGGLNPEKDENCAELGGGVCVMDGGTFTMSGTASITGNRSTGQYPIGGGVCVYEGKFTLKGGDIAKNSAESGGGVYIEKGGTFTMEGGSIVENHSHDGGGVYVNGGTLQMVKGTITQCRADVNGGGVYVNGTFTLSGAPVIKNNTKGGSANNVVLDDNTDNLKLIGPLTGGEIWVTEVDGAKPQSGAVFGTTVSGASGAKYILADVGGLIGTNENGILKWISGVPPVPVAEVTINGSESVGYLDVASAWKAATTNHAEDTVTVKLTADVETSSTLVVPASSDTGSLTLDLNGKVLKMTGTGSVISVFASGNLTLRDSSSSGEGKFTGGNAENGGGVYVSAGGEFTMEGGSITGNTAFGNGGGVYNAGTFTMYNGTIDNNTAVGTDDEESGSGGGVFVDDSGSFTMSGGTITLNNVLKNSSSGGGVFVWKTGKFEMTGTARITGNSSAGYGGGVMVYQNGTFTLNNGIIGSDNDSEDANTAAYGAGVYVENGDFTMTGGTIGYNHSSVYFGGVSFYNDTETDHTFAMSGGVIRNNSSDLEETAVIKDQGVAIGCSSEAARSHTFFTMFGSALIHGSNSLYLANGMYITVPEKFISSGDGVKSILFDGDGTLNPVVVASASSEDVALSALSHFTLHTHYTTDSEYPRTLKIDSSEKKQIVAEVDTVTVTFNSNGGSPVDSQTVVKGKTVTRPADPARENYRFANWYTDTALTTPYDFSTPVTSNLTLYAKWEEKNWQVTYYANGAVGTAPVDTKRYDTGDKVIILQPPAAMVYEEHSFVCWNTQADGTGDNYEEGSSHMMPAGGLILYAKWKENEETYTLTYDDNGATTGTAPTDSNTYAAGATVSIQGPNGLAKTGYTFSGWNIQDDGTGDNYEEGQSLTMPARDLTLYAKWTANQYTITYHSNFDSPKSTKIQERKYDDGKSLLGKDTFTRTGYTFSEWNSLSEGSGGTSYQPDYTGNLTAENGANVDLYTRWTPITYTIRFDGNGGSGTMADLTGCKYNTDIRLPANVFEKAGCTFSGWGTLARFKLIPDQSTVNFRESEIPGAEITLTAVWKELPLYTVTYDRNGATGGNVPDSQSHREGTQVTVLGNTRNLEKTGFTFSGWNDNPYGTGVDYPAGSVFTIKNNVTLYADWTPVEEYSITIHPADYGTVTATPPHASAGTTIQLMVIPDQGYQLTKLGAAPDVDIDMMNLTFTMPGENVVLSPEFALIPSPTPVPSRSNSQGSSTWITEPLTPTPTMTPTPAATPTIEVPTVKPIAQPTPSGATPVPVIGILAGLGAAAVIFGLRRP